MEDMTPYFAARVREAIMAISRGPIPDIIPKLTDYCVYLYKAGKRLPFGPSLN